MREFGASVLIVSCAWLGPACVCFAGPAEPTTEGDAFDDSFPNANWVSSPPQQAPQGLKVEAGRLTLADDYAAGRADLELQTESTKKKLTFTAIGVSLSSGGMYRRSVTLRVTRGTDTVWGTLRIYKEKQGDPDTIQIAIGKVGSTDPVTWTDASSVAIDGTQDLELSATGPKASLSFGAPPGRVSTPDIDVAPASISLCRVEIQGNPYVQARPSIDEISAVRKQ